MNTEDSLPGPTPTGYERTQGGGVKWQPPTAEHLGQLLPQYEVEALIGRGGMGAVYKARQKSLNRPVAIKILPPDMDDEGAHFVERFRNEAQLMARFTHPAIVAVYDFGETSEGQLYFIMEFVEGGDVQKMLKEQGVLPPEHALAIAAHVCDALQYAHSHGVIHRDIKPANVIINMEGQVKVADFGLAKATEDGHTRGLTATGTAMGTPDYVAPETLVLGMAADHRADLYAVGVMLYHMLTGEVPRGKFKMPSVKVGSDVRFDAIIDRAMETDREERYQSALDIRRDLDTIITTPLVQTPAQSSEKIPQQSLPQKPVARGPQRKEATFAKPQPEGGADKTVRAPSKPWLIPAALAGVAVLGIGAFFAFKSETPDPSSTPGNDSTPVVATRPSDGKSNVVPQPEPPEPPKPAVAVVTPPVPTPQITLPAEGSSQGNQTPMTVPTVPTKLLTPEPEKSSVPPDATSPPKPVLPAELALLDAQFQKLQAERVTAVFEADLLKLNTGYSGGLDREMAKEKAAGHLDAVLALESEKKLIAEKQPMPSLEDEETSNTKTPDVLKKLRGIYRDAYAKLEKQRGVNIKPITDPLMVRLVALESDYTKKDRIADAKVARNYRETLAEALKGDVEEAGAASGTAQATNPVKPITPAIGASLKDGVTNTLGMKFLPVTGTKVLFCIHTTRVKDYATYAAEVSGVEGTWKNQNKDGVPISDKDNDPVANVTRHDAQAFCGWLSKKENRTYRLPTDREWSLAVGLGPFEKPTKDSTPEGLNGKVQNVFPWGTQWPPPKGAGNFADMTFKAKFPAEKNIIEGYSDGFATTSPVMSFKPNKHGLYDMSGNVWQWVEDWWNAMQQEGVLRGGSWEQNDSGNLLSSYRYHYPPHGLYGNPGFRVVMVVR